MLSGGKEFYEYAENAGAHAKLPPKYFAQWRGGDAGAIGEKHRAEGEAAAAIKKAGGEANADDENTSAGGEEEKAKRKKRYCVWSCRGDACRAGDCARRTRDLAAEVEEAFPFAGNAAGVRHGKQLAAAFASARPDAAAIPKGPQREVYNIWRGKVSWVRSRFKKSVFAFSSIKKKKHGVQKMRFGYLA
jgi:hypothetical protein